MKATVIMICASIFLMACGQETSAPKKTRGNVTHQTTEKENKAQFKSDDISGLNWGRFVSFPANGRAKNARLMNAMDGNILWLALNRRRKGRGEYRDVAEAVRNELEEQAPVKKNGMNFMRSSVEMSGSKIHISCLLAGNFLNISMQRANSTDTAAERK